MADPEAPQETKRVEAQYGPYAGQFLDLPTADADAAISEGWARDPNAPPPENPPEWTQEGHEKTLAAAEKAARKIRGEKEPGEEDENVKAKKTKAKTAEEVKARQAENESGAEASQPAKTTDYKPEDDASKGYETRTPRRPKP